MRLSLGTDGSTASLFADLFRHAVGPRTMIWVNWATKYITERDSSFYESSPPTTQQDRPAEGQSAASASTAPTPKWVQAYLARGRSPSPAPHFRPYRPPAITHTPETKGNTRATAHSIDPTMPSLMGCPTGLTDVDDEQSLVLRDGSSNGEPTSLAAATVAPTSGQWQNSTASFPASSKWTFPTSIHDSAPRVGSYNKFDARQSFSVPQIRSILNGTSTKHVTFDDMDTMFTFDDPPLSTFDKSQQSTSGSWAGRPSKPPIKRKALQASPKTGLFPVTTPASWRDQVPDCLKVPTGPPVAQAQGAKTTCADDNMSDMVHYGDKLRAALREKQDSVRYAPSWTDKDDMTLKKNLHDLYHPDWMSGTSSPIADTRANDTSLNPSFGSTGRSGQSASEASSCTPEFTIVRERTVVKMGNDRRLIKRRTVFSAYADPGRPKTTRHIHHKHNARIRR